MWAWKNSRTNNLIELAHDFRMEAGKRAPKRGSVGIWVCFLGATQVVLERPCYTATQTTVVRERNMKNWIYFAEWSWKIATWGRVFQSAIQPVGTISLLSLSLSKLDPFRRDGQLGLQWASSRRSASKEWGCWGKWEAAIGLTIASAWLYYKPEPPFLKLTNDSNFLPNKSNSLGKILWLYTWLYQV